MAEWLRRWTANPMGSARVGSNPISVEIFLPVFILSLNFFVIFFSFQINFEWNALGSFSSSKYRDPTFAHRSNLRFSLYLTTVV